MDSILSQLLSESSFNVGLIIGYSTAFLAFLGSVVITAPYGKFASSSYGIDLDPRFGWWLMEIMATVSFSFFYIQGPNYSKPVPLFFAALFALHYANRGWLFPLSIRVAPGTKTRFSFLVSFCGIFVTSLHGYLNAMWYSKFCTYLDADWLQSPVFLFGLVLYQVSFWSTVRCEHIIRNLRNNKAKNAPRYSIPRGFLFEYVTSPQYLTELLGFAGWAIMSWNPAGVVILLISMANLVPRAFDSHKWYRNKFEDYPKDRKALIPFFI